MAIRIYNTMSRAKEELETLEPGTVEMYVCGPTVYNYIHIGNARTFLNFDMIRRYLEYSGYKVFFAQNITDVDDKIINRANEEGVPAEEIAEKYRLAFEEDMDALGNFPASRGCIRLSPEDAQWFTEWQPRGVPLVILPRTTG